MRGGHGGGGGFGGMMGGMRGLHAGGMNSPNLDNLTDEGVAGSAYDNKVVMRLLTYLKPPQEGRQYQHCRHNYLH